MIHIVMAVVSIVCIAPIILVFSISISSDVDILKNGYSFIPKHIDLAAYRFIFQNPGQLFTSYIVTIFVSIVGTVIGLLFTSMLAFAISRKDYAYANKTSFYVFFTMLINGGLIPWYILVVNQLHMKDSIFALILPYLVSAWFVMLMKGFFTNISSAIIESAKIDGASELGIFFKIVLPIAKPGLATVGLFYLLTYWNDYYLSLMFIQNNTEIISLQYMLFKIQSNMDFLKSAFVPPWMINKVSLPDLSARMAMAVLAAGPMLFVFPFFQKYFEKGITIGSIKG
ncbi:ABC transporter permease subunit [Paenibacillus sp. LMG 31460]|uniref:ABC transporter permease subunit n=2 Tax=Paenibacillus germinis TaxID=2654979 RepID=A0ABX1Z916_9BACL|nr:ABC transporter permease subunit [Paenibacillus germinis]